MAPQELTGLPLSTFKANLLLRVLGRLSEWLWLRGRLFGSYKVSALNCPDSPETFWPISLPFLGPQISQ